MTTTPYRPGDDWTIVSWTATDGDTIRAFLEALRPTAPEQRVGGLIIQPHDLIRTDPDVWPRGRSLRLVTLNTPERGKQLPDPLPDGRAGTWAEARQDLADWLGRWRTGLHCETWDIEGNFDRLLADVYVTGRRDLTASAYMLSIGWPPYLGTRS